MRISPLKIVGTVVVVITLVELFTLFSMQHTEKSRFNDQQQNGAMAKLYSNNTNLRNLIPLIKGSNSKRWLTIGIPTTERKNGTYFYTMIDSLLRKTQIKQLDKIYVVVLLADLYKTKWKDATEMTLKRKYSNLFEIGTLKVLRAPIEIYSGLNITMKNMNLKYWQTKQNYDYAFLMRHCQNLSEYYLQMEDDVITADGYIEAIQDYIKQQNGDDWVCLEFSELGFIGKLYRNRDLNDLAQFMLIFRREHPNDLNNVLFNEVKGQKRRLYRIPTLFQHIGYHSSLPDRIQPLKDWYFKENIIFNRLKFFVQVIIILAAVFFLICVVKHKFPFIQKCLRRQSI